MTTPSTTRVTVPAKARLRVPSSAAVGTRHRATAVGAVSWVTLGGSAALVEVVEVVEVVGELGAGSDPPACGASSEPRPTPATTATAAISTTAAAATSQVSARRARVGGWAAPGLRAGVDVVAHRGLQETVGAGGVESGGVAGGVGRPHPAAQVDLPGIVAHGLLPSPGPSCPSSGSIFRSSVTQLLPGPVQTDAGRVGGDVEDTGDLG